MGQAPPRPVSNSLREASGHSANQTEKRKHKKKGWAGKRMTVYRGSQSKQSITSWQTHREREEGRDIRKRGGSGRKSYDLVRRCTVSRVNESDAIGIVGHHHLHIRAEGFRFLDSGFGFLV